MSEKINVLFVCLGNICRSTMAEGIFQSVARKEPYSEYFGKIDSCGTGELNPVDFQTTSPGPSLFAPVRRLEKEVRILKRD